MTSRPRVSGEFGRWLRRDKKGEDTFWTFTQIPLISGYTRSIDPVLHANISTGGVAPKRVYLAQLLDVGTDPVPFAPPQAIAVASSNDGGLSWATPVRVAENTITGWYLDKPDMDVSQHFATQGQVYVSYSRVPVSAGADPRTSEIYVSRSTDGGNSWFTPVRVVLGRVHVSQVVVNPSTGRVYCLWVDADADQIKMSYSDDSGTTWSTPETAANGPMKINENKYINDGVSATTVPQARFDHVNNRLIVAWHESEFQATGTHTGSSNSRDRLVDSTKNFRTLGVKPKDYIRNVSDDSYCFVWDIATTVNTDDTLLVDQTAGGVQGWFSWKVSGVDKDFDAGDQYIVKARNTDIYYTAKYTATQWLPKVRLAVPLTNDQFQPAIDFDSVGDLMVGYYDRNVDSTNRLYEVRWIEFDANGNHISSGRLPDPFLSDPAEEDIDTIPGFIGDYMDHWFWPYSDSFGPRFHSVFCGERVSGNPDIYLGGIQ